MSYFQLILRRFGVDQPSQDQLLDGLSLTPDDFADPHFEMSYAQQSRLFDNLNRIYGDGWILEAPEVWGADSHGALGMAVMSAATIGEAIEVLAAYSTVHTSNQRLTLHRDDEWWSMHHSLMAELPDHQAWTASVGVALGLAALFQLLLGEASGELRYDFVRSAPDYEARIQSILGATIRWRAPFNAAALPARLTGVRSPFADPISHQAALRLLEQERRADRAPEGVKGRIENLLANSDSGRVSIAQAARTLGMSRRTLTRRLAESGASYRQLHDAELKARAGQMLDAGDMTHAEIGERLGFADPTSFGRAYRRWFKGS